MKFLKTSQFVPMKGEAWMYYECGDDMSVCRIVTHIPMTGETTLTPDPVVKVLFRPEMMLPSTEQEFSKHWALGEARKA
ncbi:MAG: hypothetical protein HUU15_13810 [Candidatus Brocadiae bacterium]|nr:hypothetical protein [Candidatus Brocadiia bacterium]